MNCVFCDIIAGRAPADIVYENDRVIVFRDHRPQASVHLLVCPKRHYATFLEAPPDETAYLLNVCRVMADKLKVQNGFRILINNGPRGGQIVFHLHVHFISWIGELPQGRLELGLD